MIEESNLHYLQIAHNDDDNFYAWIYNNKGFNYKKGLSHSQAFTWYKEYEDGIIACGRVCLKNNISTIVKYGVLTESKENFIIKKLTDLGVTRILECKG